LGYCSYECRLRRPQSTVAGRHHRTGSPCCPLDLRRRPCSLVTNPRNYI
jgi:hypothetical protein